MAGGVDGGVDNLDGGGEGLVGVDVAGDVDLHALTDEGEVGFGDVDDGLEAGDLGQREDGLAGIHLAVLVVLGADDAGELGLDEGVLVEETLAFHQLVVAGLGLVVDLLADGAGGLEGGDAVELGLGGGEVDAGGVELGLVHADEHGALLHTAAHFDVDVLDVAGDGGGDVHGLVALEGGGEFEALGDALALEDLHFHFFGFFLGGGGSIVATLAAAGHEGEGGEDDGRNFEVSIHCTYYFIR